MSEEKENESRCDLCDATFGSEQNRTAHLSGSRHRKTVEKVIAEDSKRLDASKLAFETIERRLSNVTAEVKDLERERDSFREEIDGLQNEIGANELVLKSQAAQESKMSFDIAALKCESERVEALRSDRKTLEDEIEGLKVQKVEAQKQLDQIVADIQKTVELTPELRAQARREILDLILAEELEKKRQRVELERLRQMGEISFDEYVAKKRGLSQ